MIDTFAPNPLALYDAISNTTSATIVGNARGRIVHATSSIERLLGWAPAELRGQPITMVIPKRLRSRHEAAYSRAVESGKLIHANNVLRISALHKNGDEVLIELSVTVLEDTDGDIRVIAMLRDVRSYIELENRAHDLEDRLAFAEAMTNSLTVAIVVLDERGYVSFGNDAAKTLYGDGSFNKPIEDYLRSLRLYHLDGRPYTTDELPTVRALRGESVDGERYAIRHDDGREVVVEADARPVMNGDRLLGAVLIVRSVVVDMVSP